LISLVGLGYNLAVATGFVVVTVTVDGGALREKFS
jgi:hypothetical protein